MHFYELHEGDDDVFADLLLARDDEMERRGVLRHRPVHPPPGRQDYVRARTLVEAIADELERDHGFIAVTTSG